MPLQVPKYRDLPLKQDYPAGSSWGVFDKDGKKDALGTLNFLTGEAVLAAKQEIQTGESVVLNLPLHLPHNACEPRRATEHTRIEGAMGYACCDDELHMNTQSTSQWDGLLHWANQERREYYNGVKYADAVEAKTDTSLGIHAFSERGGIVGRGVLLDFVLYARKNSIEYDPLSNYAITLPQLKAMVQDEGLQLRQGDILVIRTGLSKWIRASTPADAGPFNESKYIGIDSSDPAVLEWVWDQGFAAVASDACAVEAIPGVDGSFLKFHTAALAGWGMPLGELWDLEALAAVAERVGRWSFFLVAAPLNIKDGASSLANTVGIF